MMNTHVLLRNIEDSNVLFELDIAIIRNLYMKSFSTSAKADTVDITSMNNYYGH